MNFLKDFDLNKKRVLVRCDFNVPFSPEREILDDFRIRETIPTIEYLIKKEAKVILMSHLGKPEGKIVENLRLDKIQEKLIEYLDLSIVKAPDCIGKEIENWVSEMAPGEILLLENLRFHKEEEKNDENFAKALAKLGDIYINEAFACSHRFHASIVGVPKYLPSGAGFLLEKEINSLNKIIENPQKPLVSIFGGDDPDFKMVDKISNTADWILIGELVGKGIEIGNTKLKYPEKVIKPVDGIDGGRDIGPKTMKLFKEKILRAKTIFWSGPLGKIEEERFQKGTKEVAKAIIESGAFSVIGGGETIEFINKLGFIDRFSHVSTGGSAMLAYLAGEKLPGIEALRSAS
jgi:phosphoglycerate kinase